VHQQSFHSKTSLSRDNSLNHHMPKASYVPPRKCERQYSTKLSPEAQKRVVERVFERYQKAATLPSPGEPAYERYRNDVGAFIKHGGNHLLPPNFALTEMEGATNKIRQPELLPPRKPHQLQRATKSDIQEVKEELKGDIKELKVLMEQIAARLSTKKTEVVVETPTHETTGFSNLASK
jgi:vacuolar-type H+-ATPase subunit I/STV1